MGQRHVVSFQCLLQTSLGKLIKLRRNILKQNWHRVHLKMTFLYFGMKSQFYCDVSLCPLIPHRIRVVTEINELTLWKVDHK